jgi:predicted nucleic acid-binding protein
LNLFFDSSVLVPVFYANHEHHNASKRVFLSAGKEDFCARRSLGEVYATLTGLPLRPRITGPQAIGMINAIRSRLTLVSLTDAEYLDTFESASSQGIVGNTAYDALIARCAEKAGSTILLTWNLQHFRRLPNVAHLIRTPAEV